MRTIFLVAVLMTAIQLNAQSARLLTRPIKERVTPETVKELREKRDREQAAQARRNAEMVRLASNVEMRRLDGTNYNVGYLRAWLSSDRSTPRPLPAWEQISGVVVESHPDGLLVREQKREPIYDMTVKPRALVQPDQYSRLGVYVSGGPLPAELYRKTRPIIGYKTVDGSLLLLKGHPDGQRLRKGAKIECVAMGRISDGWKEGEDWVFIYEHGEATNSK